MTVIVTNSDNSKCRINQDRYRDVQKSRVIELRIFATDFNYILYITHMHIQHMYIHLYIKRIVWSISRVAECKCYIIVSVKYLF